MRLTPVVLAALLLTCAAAPARAQSSGNVYGPYSVYGPGLTYKQPTAYYGPYSVYGPGLMYRQPSSSVGPYGTSVRVGSVLVPDGGEALVAGYSSLS